MTIVTTIITILILIHLELLDQRLIGGSIRSTSAAKRTLLLQSSSLGIKF